MHIRELIQHLGKSDQALVQDLDVTGISIDSRKVLPGHLFVALPSASAGADGTQFIEQAIANGAVAVLWPEPSSNKWVGKTCYLSSADIYSSLAVLLPLFYPQKPEVTVAVTGTNGKTSVVRFAQQLWTALGIKAASIGTLGVDAYPDLKTLTSPDPVTLHDLLQQLAQDNFSHVALEASSHGLAQRRLAGVKLAAAAFTNLSHDHLDYHKTLEEYFKAKQLLFSEVLQPGAVAVLNAQTPEYATLQDLCRTRQQKILSYGGKGADLAVMQRQALPEGQQLNLNICGTSYEVLLPLMGEFQAMNVLCALGLVIASGAESKKAVDALSELKPVAGRLEHVVTSSTGVRVYVDYAHTPAALETVLRALRQHTSGKLVVIFGCGGERDQQKRPVMGNIAASFADQVLVTDDNPRGENPETIRREIMLACPDATEVGDRRQAIHSAIAGANQNDIILIAGKGHENVQIVGDHTLPFSDTEVVRNIV